MVAPNSWSLPQFTASGVGFRTPFATTLPPGARVAGYVHHDGAIDGNDQDVNAGIYTTLNAALGQCRAGKGDYVIALPGHAESFAAADSLSSLVAGTNIACLGEGMNRATFTWSAATSSALLDKANVTWDNAIMYMEGQASGSALSVAAPITVSAEGCRISNCWIKFAHDADEKATIGITTTADADDFTFAHNQCWGVDASEVTTFLRLVGADRCKIIGNNIQGSTSSTTVGLVQFLTTASQFVIFDHNTVVNNKDLSVHAVTGMAALLGTAASNNFGILDTATAAGLETEGALQTFKNHTSNEAGTEGIAKTPATTV